MTGFMPCAMNSEQRAYSIRWHMIGKLSFHQGLLPIDISSVRGALDCRTRNLWLGFCAWKYSLTVRKLEFGGN